MRWSDSAMLKFFDLYESHECLWNTKVDSYKNINAKERALATVVKEMEMPGLTIDILKKKIKVIRTVYRREHNRVAQSRINGDEYIYKPRLFWFDRADSFLNGIINEINTQLLEKSLKNYEKLSCIQKPAKRKRADKKNKELKNLNEIVFEEGEEMIHVDNSINKLETSYNTTDEDDCALFGQMVACELRKLNNKHKAVAKNRIQNLIFDLQIEEMSYESQQPKRYYQVPASKASSSRIGDMQLCEIDLE